LETYFANIPDLSLYLTKKTKAKSSGLLLIFPSNSFLMLLGYLKKLECQDIYNANHTMPYETTKRWLRQVLGCPEWATFVACRLQVMFIDGDHKGTITYVYHDGINIRYDNGISIRYDWDEIWNMLNEGHIKPCTP
jgi:hypothetical protein